MTNSTQVSYFTLDAYFDLGLLKYLYFLIILSLYIVIDGANLLLIVVICANRSLHEPMFVFLCSLFVNELYGSAGLFPLVLTQVLSDVHAVSAPLCFLQIYSIHTYVVVEYFMLALMSYDRYLAICYPLQYNTRMVFKRVAVLVAAAWLLPFLIILSMTCLSFSLQLCGNVVYKVYCDNYSVVKLACSDTTVNNVYGLIVTVFTVFGPVVLILYTYLRILKVCFSGCKRSRQKAVSTCTPHLASVVNFCFGCCFEVIQSRFDMSGVPNMLRIFLSLYFLTCQPLFTPVMYGLKMSKIHQAVKSLFSVKST